MPAEAGEQSSIAFVVESLNPGGTERLVVEMSRAFTEHMRVTVLCLNEPGQWAADLRNSGIAVYGLRRQPGLDLSIAVKIARLCRHLNVDIIHAHQCTPWFYSALSRLFYRAPKLLLEEHGRFYPEVDNRKRRWFNRAIVCPLTHRFVAVSRDVRRRLMRYEGIPGDRIEVIYNGVAAAPKMSVSEREILRQSLGFDRSDFIVGTVGRFDPIKNLPMLVDSIDQASAAEDRVRGLLVGDGPLFDDIKLMVESRSLTDRILLTGYRSDVDRLLQIVDLFVLPSFSEGTSMALLEAMAAGVPVAVTEVGGNPEIVDAGRTGWVIPSGAADQLTAAILEAVADAGKLDRFAEAGERRFGDHFTLDGMLAAYRGVYAAMLPAGGPIARRSS